MRSEVEIQAEIDRLAVEMSELTISQTPQNYQDFRTKAIRLMALKWVLKQDPREEKE